MYNHIKKQSFLICFSCCNISLRFSRKLDASHHKFFEIHEKNDGSFELNQGLVNGLNTLKNDDFSHDLPGHCIILLKMLPTLHQHKLIPPDPHSLIERRNKTVAEDIVENSLVLKSF